MGKKPRYTNIDGMRLLQAADPEIYRAATKFKAGKDDVVVVTYPKCGTTLALQIASLILRNGEPLVTYEDYFFYIPFLELTPMEEMTRIPKPRCIKTHLSFDGMNFSGEAKYIYVARHPADCVVSYYYHTRLFPTYFFTDGTLDDYFEEFIKGEVSCNDYFDHLLSGYERRNEPNVLFMTYESIVSNKHDAVLKIGRFLGEEYYKNLTRNDESLLEKVLEYSSLEFMKSTVNDFWQRRLTSFPTEEAQRSNPVLRRLAEALQEATTSGEVSKGNFIRHGVVGEGKTALSAEQLKKLDKRISEKTANSDVMNLWRDV